MTEGRDADLGVKVALSSVSRPVYSCIDKGVICLILGRVCRKVTENMHYLLLQK